MKKRDKANQHQEISEVFAEGTLIVNDQSFEVLEHMSIYPFTLFELMPYQGKNPFPEYDPLMFKHFVSAHKPSEVEYISRSDDLFSLQKSKYWDTFDPLFSDENHPGAQVMREVVINQYKEIAQRIAALTPKRELFVVGCSNGKMFDVFSQYGFACSGIEPNKFTSSSAIRAGKNVSQASIDSYVCEKPHEIVVELGVLSMGVTPRSYVKAALPKIRSFLSQGGLYVHAPYNRSHLDSSMLAEQGFEVLAKSIPPNFFDPRKYPKQFYVGMVQ